MPKRELSELEKYEKLSTMMGYVYKHVMGLILFLNSGEPDVNQARNIAAMISDECGRWLKEYGYKLPLEAAIDRAKGESDEEGRSSGDQPLHPGVD